jgi:hypothetical protein
VESKNPGVWTWDRIQCTIVYIRHRIRNGQMRKSAKRNYEVHKSIWKTLVVSNSNSIRAATMCGCACGARRLYRNSPGLMSATLERGHRDLLSVRRAGNQARRHEEERNAVGTLQCLDAPSPAHRSSAGFALSTLVMHRAVTAAAHCEATCS